MNFSFELPKDHSVRAGGELKGKLYMSVKKPVKGTSIECEFQGYEQTTIYYTVSDAEGNSVARYEHGKHLKFCQRISVPNQDRLIQNGKLVPGDYVVPFCVSIPSNSPASKTLADSGGHKAGIEYCLRAELKDSGMVKNYQANKIITVTKGEANQSPTVVPPKPHVTAPQTQDIKRMGLIHKGRISYGAKIANANLVIGEAPTLQLAIINDSQAPVQFVQTTLQQVIWFSAGGRTETIKYKFGRKRISGHDIPGSAALDRQGRKQAKDSDWNQRVQQALKGGNHGTVQCSLPPVPAEAMETYQGGIITISHEIVVKIETSEGLANPEFTVPIHITHGVRSAAAAQPQSTDTLPVAYATPILHEKVTAVVYKPSVDARVGLGMGRDAQGRLVVTSVGGLFEREGSLSRGMRILEINGISLAANNDPHQAVAILKNATSQVIVVAQK